MTKFKYFLHKLFNTKWNRARIYSLSGIEPGAKIVVPLKRAKQKYANVKVYINNSKQKQMLLGVYWSDDNYEERFVLHYNDLEFKDFFTINMHIVQGQISRRETEIKAQKSLEEQLREALDNENYERAAEIREKINNNKEKDK